MKENNIKSNELRNYKEFKEDSYKYRVDEILDYICENDRELLQLFEKETLNYNQLKELLGENDQKLLIQYADTQNDVLEYENYALAKYIYEDLEK